MDDLHAPSGFVRTIVNPHRGVEDRSNISAFNDDTQVRKCRQQVDVIEQRIAESPGCFAVVLADVLEDFEEPPRPVGKQLLCTSSGKFRAKFFHGYSLPGIEL